MKWNQYIPRFDQKTLENTIGHGIKYIRYPAG